MVGLSTPLYTRSYQKVHCSRGALFYFKSNPFFFSPSLLIPLTQISNLPPQKINMVHTTPTPTPISSSLRALLLDEPAVGDMTGRLSPSFQGTKTYVSQVVYNLNASSLSLGSFWPKKARCVLVVNGLFCLLICRTSKAVKGMIPLVDIMAINVTITSTTTTVHFATSTAYPDWHFQMTPEGSHHSNYDDILLTLDKLRLLCLHDPISLRPWGPIVKKTVGRGGGGGGGGRKAAALLTPPQLLAGYRSKKMRMPKRVHRVGATVLLREGEAMEVGGEEVHLLS